MRIKRFEDLDAWQEARSLTNMVYNLTTKSLFSKDYGLKDQVQKASISTMSNIAEGLDSGSDKQFIQFLLYARRSSSEVQSELYVALDRKYVKKDEFQKTYEQARLVGKLCNGFIRYLRKG